MQPINDTKNEKETILWLDDEEIALDIWSQTLERLGYKVLQARSGYEAIEVFEKNKNKVSLVILDMQMPGMNGREVYDQLKRIHPDVKVLLLSGYIGKYSAEELSRFGFDGFVKKPFELKKLLEKINELLDK